MLAYPGFEPLDLVGPHCILSGLANTRVHLVWKTNDAITTEGRFSIVPTTSIAQCPRDLDVLFVPGGTWGTVAMMGDEEVLSFLADRGSRARFVTSVCTGSLILGSAGLLQGYEATSHWMFRDILPVFGAKPVEERVVQDRNRMTGGGVTSGVDFGLVLASNLRGREVAETMQLSNEYDPQPPFRAGSPTTADPAILSAVRERLDPTYRQMRKAADEAHSFGHLGSA
ncbi:DJ-1/PfpI family protein [Sphingomonas sp. So64.6b]|uniref:DJ-1/PfpI family protein n=1 Tax=Sphingomonas sp. So64.6b TaxID=2997354 RepID=UPI001602F6AC|nr:DJ-1/PfpI family protein [Sphingomonas sp. So64.6b]QNA85485.1 DJ-1/PfpI family protein [Sphingomonas sp. So64.6b]